MSYPLPELPYDEDALELHSATVTMTIHHQGYPFLGHFSSHSLHHPTGNVGKIIANSPFAKVESEGRLK